MLPGGVAEDAGEELVPLRLEMVQHEGLDIVPSLAHGEQGEVGEDQREGPVVRRPLPSLEGPVYDLRGLPDRLVSRIVEPRIPRSRPRSGC